LRVTLMIGLSLENRASKSGDKGLSAFNRSERNLRRP